MAEIIDMLLIFWFVLAVLVYILGQIVQNQTTNKDTRLTRTKSDKRKNSSQDDWSPTNWGNNNTYSSSSSGGGNQPASAVRRHDDFMKDRSYSNYDDNSQNQFRSNSGSYSNPNYAAADQSHQFNSSSSSSTMAAHRGVIDPSSYYEPHHSSAQMYPLSSSYPTTFNNELQQQVGLDQYGNLLAAVDQQQRKPQQTTFDSAAIPTASGYNQDCVEWVNSILYLFYTQSEKYGPIICESIYRSLNEKLSNITNSSTEYNDLMIEFNGINRDSSSRPELTNVRTESESERSVSANCKIYNRRISLNMCIRRLLSSSLNEDDAASQYEVVLENLEGKLKSMAMLNDKLIVIQFLEKPDTKIWLKPKPKPKQQQHYQQQQQPPLINEDNLVQIILQTLTQVVVDLYFGDDIDFPQFKLAGHQQRPHQTTYSNYKNKINTLFKGSASELKRQLKHDFFGSLSSSTTNEPAGVKERRLFVKIVRAKNINYNRDATCIIELDVPNQQAISSTKTGSSSNPHWDEHFLFNVSEKSNELKLELWDSIDSANAQIIANQSGAADGGSSSATRQQNKFNKAELTAAAKFLGFATIKMDDLRKNPVQKVNLSLQPMGRPSDLNNSVGGELQLELLFLEHSSSPTTTAAAAAAAGIASNQDGADQPPTSSTAHRRSRTPQSGANLRKSTSANSLAYQQGDVVSIDRKLTPSGYVITTTTITKQKNSAPRPTSLAAHQQPQPHLRNPSPISSVGATEHSFELGDSNDGGSGVASGNPQSSMDRRSEAPSDLAATGGGGADGRLSRSRSRSRSFLRAIKKRFSFSRTRSRSVGGESPSDRTSRVGGDNAATAAATADDTSNYNRSEAPSALGGYSDTLSMQSPSRASSELSHTIASGGGGGLGMGSNRAKSVPTTRDPNEVPTIVINKSRLSDAGSVFTFTHPKSQLVIEVLEPVLRDRVGESSTTSGNSKNKTRPRYYAIPENSANKRKWSRRGLKLHLFNEHQFVACHLAGSSTCHLCGRVFSRRPGKQGYKCRNCHFLSHKECHVKVDHNCPYASRDGLKLEYIDSDPPANLIDELQQQQQQSVETPVLEDTENYRASTYSKKLAHSGSGGAKSKRIQAKSISMEVDDR